MSDYNSIYTGSQIDEAFRDKTVAITQAEFNNLDASQMSTNKLYIITNGDSANTLWRSNGVTKVPIGGGINGLSTNGVIYTGTVTLGTGLKMSGNVSGGTLSCNAVSYSSVAPDSYNPSGVGFVIMPQPAGSFTVQTGWLYFILEA